jgi:hypothetical protein
LFDIFRNPFVQNLVLLLLTALLTGLLVPYVLNIADDRKSARQKEREAALARQAKIIDAQSALLDDLSRQLWRWRYLSMRLAYYGSKDTSYGNQDMTEQFKQAEEDYERELWDVLNQMRNEISRSRRLVSEQAYQQLLTFYKEDMMALENDISNARREERDIDKYTAFLAVNHKIFGDVTARIDEMLNNLAEEMNLKGPSST